MNAPEFTITLRRSCASFDLSSSTPAPEISETYPGTSGNTHGDRNEMSPATKAAIGSGSVDIGIILPVLPRKKAWLRASPFDRETRPLRTDARCPPDVTGRWTAKHEKSRPCWRAVEGALARRAGEAPRRSIKTQRHCSVVG